MKHIINKRSLSLLLTLATLFTLTCFSGFSVKAATIEDGIYYIKNYNNAKYFSYVNGSSSATSYAQNAFGLISNAVPSQGSPQQWYITSTGDGYYSITSYITGAFVGYDSTTASFTSNITLGDKFKWKIDTLSSGRFSICPKTATAQCVQTTGITDGTTLQFGTYTGANNQQWILEGMRVVQDGTYFVKNVNSGKFLTAYQAVTLCQLATYTDNYRKWKFEYQTNGYYKITVSTESTLRLRVNGTADQGGLGVYVSAGTTMDTSTYWQLRRNSDGTVHFIPRTSYTKCMQVVGSSTADNASIEIAAPDNSNNQKWLLVA